jgi:pimeloyl-ACP methyl ester carboxylesterase
MPRSFSTIARALFPAAIDRRAGPQPGGVAILHAAETPEVGALVTWAAIAHADRFGEAEKEAWRRGGTVGVVNARTGQTFQLRRDFLDDLESHRERYDLLARAREVSCPWLLLHGADDESVPCAEGTELCRAAAARGRRSVAPERRAGVGAHLRGEAPALEHPGEPPARPR